MISKVWSSSIIQIMKIKIINPLDLYALPNLVAYKVTGPKITPFVPAATEDIGVEKIVPGLLFKCEDIFDVENRYGFYPLNMDDGKATHANTKNDGKKNSPEIEKMINNARPEVEKLYRAVKRIRLSGRKQGTCEQYRDAALEFFRENSGDFKLVKESYLPDWNLYSFRPGKAKDDFIGKLLLIIAKELKLGINNYQELYKIYKSTKRLQ